MTTGSCEGLKWLLLYMPKFGQNQASVQICTISSIYTLLRQVYKFVVFPRARSCTNFTLAWVN